MSGEWSKNSVFVPSPPRGRDGGAAPDNGAYDILRVIRWWEYVCDVLYWLFVRNVINNRWRGREIKDYA